MGTQTLAIGSVRMFRYAFGTLLLLAGTALLVAHGLAWLNLEPRILRALQGGAICARHRAGAVPVLVIRRMPMALSDTLLGFGAGVMLAATAFSLVVPGIAAAESLGLSPWGAGGLISFGIMLGAFGLYLVDRKVSGASPEMLVGTPDKPVIPPRIWLFVFCHHCAQHPGRHGRGCLWGGGMADADSLAMGIALQDVPEGLVIALVLAGAGMSRVKAFLIGAASGLVEPVFAVLCAWLVSLAEVLLLLSALAAGAMLLVVTHEVIPESRRNGHEKLASLGQPRVLPDDGDGYGVGLRMALSM